VGGCACARACSCGSCRVFFVPMSHNAACRRPPHSPPRCWGCMRFLFGACFCRFYKAHGGDACGDAGGGRVLRRRRWAMHDARPLRFSKKTLARAAASRLRALARPHRPKHFARFNQAQGGDACGDAGGGRALRRRRCDSRKITRPRCSGPPPTTRRALYGRHTARAEDDALFACGRVRCGV